MAGGGAGARFGGRKVDQGQSDYGVGEEVSEVGGKRKVQTGYMGNEKRWRHR